MWNSSESLKPWRVHTLINSPAAIRELCVSVLLVSVNLTPRQHDWRHVDEVLSCALYWKVCGNWRGHCSPPPFFGILLSTPVKIMVASRLPYHGRFPPSNALPIWNTCAEPLSILNIGHCSPWQLQAPPCNIYSGVWTRCFLHNVYSVEMLLFAGTDYPVILRGLIFKAWKLFPV